VFSTMVDVGCAPQLTKIAELLVAGHLRLPPLREYPLRDAPAAHRDIQTGHTRGKIVLKVADL
jgi:NADPH2:quinone reductase